jgi:hypothetical protein
MWNTYAGTTTITLANGTYNGQYKRFTYVHKTASNTVVLKTGSTGVRNLLDFGELPNAELENNMMTFSDEGEFVDLVWSTEVPGAGSHLGPAWVIVRKDGIVVGAY